LFCTSLGDSGNACKKVSIEELDAEAAFNIVKNVKEFGDDLNQSATGALYARHICKHAPKTELSEDQVIFSYKIFPILLPSGQVLESLYPCWTDIAIFDLVKAMERSLTVEMFHDLMGGREKLLLAMNRIDNMEQVKTYYLKNPNKNASILWAKVSYVAWASEYFEAVHLLFLMTKFTKSLLSWFEKGRTLILTYLGILKPKHMAPAIAPIDDEPTSPQ
jgi:hypothetical protein